MKKKSATQHNLISFYAVLSALGPIACLVILSSYYQNVLLNIFSFLILGLLFQRVSLLTHESWHKHLFTDSRVNNWVGKWLLSYPFITRWNSQRDKHFEHHRLALTKEDPDFYYWGWEERDSKQLVSTILQFLTGYFTIQHILNVLRNKEVLSEVKKGNAVFRLPEKEKSDGEKESLWGLALVQLVILFIFIQLFSIQTGPLFYLLLWIMPLLTVNAAASYWRQFVEHNRGRMLIFDCNLVEKYFFGDFGFTEHGVHHLVPSLYWYELKKFREQQNALYQEKCKKKQIKIQVAKGYFSEFVNFLGSNSAKSNLRGS